MIVPTDPAAILASVEVLPPRGLNTRIYLDINDFSRHTAWAHGFMHAYALWLGPALLVAIFLVAYFLAWWRRAPYATVLLAMGGIGTLVALGLNQLVGHAAEELRPYATHPQALVLVGKANDYSFPSDHAVVAGALAASVLLVLGRRPWRSRGSHAAGAGSQSRPVATSGRPVGALWAVATTSVVLGLFLCFARVYVGAHYPGDVVAGLLLGGAVVVVVSLLRPLGYWLADVVDKTPVGSLIRRPSGRVSGPATGSPGAPEAAA